MQVIKDFDGIPLDDDTARGIVALRCVNLLPETPAEEIERNLALIDRALKRDVRLGIVTFQGVSLRYLRNDLSAAEEAYWKARFDFLHDNEADRQALLAKIGRLRAAIRRTEDLVGKPLVVAIELEEAA